MDMSGTKQASAPSSFFQWWASNRQSLCKKPWVVLGKGPSADKADSQSLSNYSVFGLNHVCLKHRVDVLHVVDLEVLLDCEKEIDENCDMLCMPWIPHARFKPWWNPRLDKFKPCDQSLLELKSKVPLLDKLFAESRVIWYNLSTAKARDLRDNSPIVKPVAFSSTIAVELLAMVGCKKIYTLGVDGGTQYASAFVKIEKKTKLRTGQESYDIQFTGIARTMNRHDCKVEPIGIESPIRIFVGMQKEQWLAFKVLEYTIKKHASMPVQVTALSDSINDAGISIPRPNQKTPFSFQRFAIPELKNYSGRAIYLDSDMQVFSDIRQLWCADMQAADLLCVEKMVGLAQLPQYSVMLLDCEKLKWHVESIVENLNNGCYSYNDLMHEMVVANNPQMNLDSGWNHLDFYKASQTKLIHYTNMLQQPWLSHANPFAHLWFSALFEAIDEGFIGASDVEREIELGHVRPSVMTQLNERLADPVLLPSTIRRKEVYQYCPPHLGGSEVSAKDLGVLKRFNLYGNIYYRNLRASASNQVKRFVRRFRRFK